MMCVDRSRSESRILDHPTTNDSSEVAIVVGLRVMGLLRVRATLESTSTKSRKPN